MTIKQSVSHFFRFRTGDLTDWAFFQAGIDAHHFVYSLGLPQPPRFIPPKCQRSSNNPHASRRSREQDR